MNRVRAIVVADLVVFFVHALLGWIMFIHNG